jgi:hypothetical protein
MTQIQQIAADLISENQCNQRHQRSIQESGIKNQVSGINHLLFANIVPIHQDV